MHRLRAHELPEVRTPETKSFFRARARYHCKHILVPLLPKKGASFYLSMSYVRKQVEGICLLATLNGRESESYPVFCFHTLETGIFLSPKSGSKRKQTEGVASTSQY